MTVTGSYFCACVRMKFSRNDFPAPVAPCTSVCPTSSYVQVPEVRRLVLGLEDRQALAAAEVRAGALRPCRSVNRKLRSATVRVEQRQAPQVVRRRCRARPRARRSSRL